MRGRRSLGPAVLAFAMGMLLTLAIWELASGEVAKRRQAKFDALVQTVQGAIRDRMLAYEQILLGGAGLINALGEVHRAQWASYVASLDAQKNYPGVHGVGFAEYVVPQNRDAFIRRMANQGMPQYQIRPPGERDAYAPVTFLEPRTDRNLRAHGFDMLSEPVRQAAMLVARDSGETAITARLKLASEPNESPVYGFLVYLPVYRSQVPLDTVDQRRQHLKGFVNSPFRMNDLMKGILGSNDDQLQLRVYDGEKAAPELLLFASAQTAAAGADPWLRKTASLKLHNRVWTVEYAMPLSQRVSDNGATLLVLVAGTLISVLLGALTLSMTARMNMIRHSEQHYFQLANFDSLTRLPNRSMFHQRLSHTLQQAERTQHAFALIFLDLDNFKTVNDRYGHEAGDIVLKAVAARLLRCMRKADTVARLGGDEFVVILHEIRDGLDAGKAARSILDALANPIDLPGEVYAVSVSMGIALYPGDAKNADELLKRADRAMYASKTQGRNQYFFFTPALLDMSLDTAPTPLA